MTTRSRVQLSDLIARHEVDLLREWLREQAATTRRADVIGDETRERESSEFLALLASTNGGDVDGAVWNDVRDFLAGLSRTRAEAGLSPADTAMFVFSLKQPLFAVLLEELGDDAAALAAALWETNVVLDRLGLLTTEEHQRSREAVINRQQRDLLELSTPVVKLWEGVVAVPLIGTLDSERAQVVTESLLDRIVETNATIAIIDITGVPTVDTLVAQHLLKTVAAARLMGADCLISGIRPQIAQTIVHLGLTLTDVTTKATLADAIAVALERGGLRIAPIADEA